MFGCVLGQTTQQSAYFSPKLLSMIQYWKEQNEKHRIKLMETIFARKITIKHFVFMFILKLKVKWHAIVYTHTRARWVCDIVSHVVINYSAAILHSNSHMLPNTFELNWWITKPNLCILCVCMCVDRSYTNCMCSFETNRRRKRKQINDSNMIHTHTHFQPPTVSLNRCVRIAICSCYNDAQFQA